MAVKPPGPDTLLIYGEARALRSYGSFEAARDSVEAILRRVLRAGADSAVWKRERIAFQYREAFQRAAQDPGGRMHWALVARDTTYGVPSLVVTLETARGETPVLPFDQALAAAGWIEDVSYAKAGLDAQVRARLCREALCVVQTGWAVGDESDSTSVPVPGESLRLTCVPAPPVWKPTGPSAR